MCADPNCGFDYRPEDMIGEDDLTPEERAAFDERVLFYRNLEYVGGKHAPWEFIPFACIRTQMARHLRGLYDWWYLIGRRSNLGITIITEVRDVAYGPEEVPTREPGYVLLASCHGHAPKSGGKPRFPFPGTNWSDSDIVTYPALQEFILAPA